MPHATTASAPFSPGVTRFESAFIRTVLEHRGLFREPSLAEFAAAHAVLRRFEEQRQDNPGGVDFWEPVLDEEGIASLRAKAFLMFGATKPTPAQWHKAHTALFGPLLCETCG
jgi:predicted metal-dependent HD superfamily phosphohydrolase